jgi:DNA polymerase-1
MTLLIDADWLLYSGCAACECDIRWDEWTHTLHLEEGEVKDFVTSRLEYWRGLTGDNQVIMCLSDYPTFRHVADPNYKVNRIGKRKPLGLRDLRQWIERTYECRSCIGLEADDVMGLLATGGQYKNAIVVSIDKDMRTIPGQLLAGEQVESITVDQANKAWMTQVLTGDSTDGYQGLKGCGPVKAEKILDDAVDLPELWIRVTAAYRKGGMTYADALHSARLARILRHGDYDFSTSEVRLWDPAVDPGMRTM